MNHTVSRLALAMLLAFFVSALQAQDAKQPEYQEGLHYQLIEGAPARADGPQEVVEAFSYLCSHCAAFEPFITSWVQRKPENVEFRRLPVVFGRGSWEIYARAYLTADMLNVADEGHAAMMDRLWKEKKVMRSMDELADFYSNYGVDKEKFLATTRSFAVESRLKRDQLDAQNYGVHGTPSLILNGKYLLSGSAAVPNYDVMLDVLDFLIAKESSASQQNSVASN